MCYGDCPIYRVEVNDNGKVVWEGIDYVSKMGRHEWTIRKGKIEKLNSLISSFGYRTYEYSPSEEGFATDHPSCITQIEFQDGYVKEIDHYLGFLWGLEDLTKFENDLEKIIGTKKYVKEPMYIYYIVFREESIRNGYKGHIVVAGSEESALRLIPLGEESRNRDGNYIIDKSMWEIRKIGKETRNSLYPYVVMSEAVK